MKDKDKELLDKIKSFFMDDFHSEEELMKSMSLTDLIIHDQYGKQAYLETNKFIETKAYVKLGLTEEKVYHDRSCILANLESVTKCIGNHYGLITCFHTDLEDNIMIFKINKN